MQLSTSYYAEYTADELAEDSEDEKRIFKAEKAAERKSVKRRRAAAPPRPKIRAQSSVVPVTGSTVGPLQHRRSMPISYAQAVRPPKPLGPCFVCGEMGHLKNFCTKMTDASNSKKWYPSQYGFMCVDGVDVWDSSVDTDSVGNSAGGGSKECEPAIGQEELVGSDTSDCCECVDLECCMENAVDLCGRTWEAEAVSPQPSAQAFCDSVSCFVDLLLEATVIITQYNSYSIVFCMFTSNVLDSIVTTAGTPIKNNLEVVHHTIFFSHHT